MLTVHSPDLDQDADQLEGRWGIPIALQMLHERVITVVDFFELCQEAAEASTAAHRDGAAVGAREPTR